MAISPLELESKSDHAREDDTEDNHNGSGSNSSDESFGSPLHRRRSNRQRIQSIEIEDEEFGEALGLLGHPIANHTDFEEETPQGRRNSARAWVWWIVTMILVAVISRIFYRKEQQWVEMHGNDRLPPVSYECPVADDTPKNDEQAKSASHSVAPPPSNIPGGDSVEYSYEQLRTNFKEWTVKHIAPYILKFNDEGIINRVSILETASHTLGLNLFLTLDILEEIQASSNNPTKFWVYGNDRDPFRSSFAFFRQDREKMAQLPNVHLGMFCAAEDAPPMDLSYIPEEAFDIVYCGHLP